MSAWKRPSFSCCSSTWENLSASCRLDGAWRSLPRNDKVMFRNERSVAPMLKATSAHCRTKTGMNMWYNKNKLQKAIPKTRIKIQRGCSVTKIIKCFRQLHTYTSCKIHEQEPSSTCQAHGRTASTALLPEGRRCPAQTLRSKRSWPHWIGSIPWLGQCTAKSMTWKNLKGSSCVTNEFKQLSQYRNQWFQCWNCEPRNPWLFVETSKPAGNSTEPSKGSRCNSTPPNIMLSRVETQSSQTGKPSSGGQNLKVDFEKCWKVSLW